MCGIRESLQGGSLDRSTFDFEVKLLSSPTIFLIILARTVLTVLVLIIITIIIIVIIIIIDRINRLKKESKIDKRMFYNAYPSDPVPPRMYGMLQAHKPTKGYPMK